MWIDKVMYLILLLIAISTNISTVGVSIGLVTGFLLLVVKYIKQPFLLNIDRKLQIAFVTFFSTQILAVIFSFDSVTSFNIVFAEVNRLLVILLVMVFVKDRKTLLNILLAVSISIFITDIYAVWQSLQGTTRPAGIGNNAAFFACQNLLCLGMLMVYPLECQKLGKWQKYWLQLVGIIAVLALYVSNTRGAWLTFIGMIVTYFCFTTLQKKKVILMISGGLMILLSLTFFTSASFHNRILSIGSLHDISNMQRVYFAQGTKEIFLHYPILGVGQGQFQHFYNDVYIPPQAEKAGYANPHNIFLTALAESGIVGLVGLCMLFYYTLWHFYCIYRRDNQNYLALGFLLSTVGLLGAGMTDYPFGLAVIMRLYWLLFGLAYVEEKINNKEKNEKMSNT